MIQHEDSEACLRCGAGFEAKYDGMGSTGRCLLCGQTLLRELTEDGVRVRTRGGHGALACGDGAALEASSHALRPSQRRAWLRALQVAHRLRLGGHALGAARRPSSAAVRAVLAGAPAVAGINPRSPGFDPQGWVAVLTEPMRGSANRGKWRAWRFEPGQRVEVAVLNPPPAADSFADAYNPARHEIVDYYGH